MGLKDLSTAQVQKVYELRGYSARGILDCIKSLQECEWDMRKAKIEVLQRGGPMKC